MTQLIDLSQEIYQGMEVYPGHQKAIIWQPNKLEKVVGKRFIFSGLPLDMVLRILLVALVFLPSPNKFPNDKQKVKMISCPY